MAAQRMSLARYKKLAKPKKKGRIQSKKIEYNGILFKSKKEVNIYIEYQLDPKIEILSIEPKFKLLESFKHGQTIRSMSYKADFKIINNGIVEVVEVKSKGSASMTDYQLRKKLFLHKYPTVNFREIIFDGDKRTENYYKGEECQSN